MAQVSGTVQGVSARSISVNLADKDGKVEVRTFEVPAKTGMSPDVKAGDSVTVDYDEGHAGIARKVR